MTNVFEHLKSIHRQTYKNKTIALRESARDHFYSKCSNSSARGRFVYQKKKIGFGKKRKIINGRFTSLLHSGRGPENR